MYLEFTEEQKDLRTKLRQYFAEMMTGELRQEIIDTGEGGGPLYRKALRKMGADGWLGIGWPKEYGGQGRSYIEQFIFSEEVQRVGYPLPFLTINCVGPTIMQFGTEEQKHEFLPRILHGEMHCAIGYSEPSAGTDLASLTTRAVRDGDEYVINGSKVFTSLANYADYIWLAARTDPTAKKHHGISIFLVDTKLPGYKCTPIWTISGLRTNTTYYEDLRIPASMRIGPENSGWSLIVNQLNHERIALVALGPTEEMMAGVRRWAAGKRIADGSRVIDQPWVQLKLARVHARLEALKLFNWRQAWCLSNGNLNFADASTVKVYGSEFYVEAYRDLIEILGSRGHIQRDSPEAVIQGQLERAHRTALILTFGGGTNEIQRDIIAMAGLQMPRELR